MSQASLHTTSHADIVAAVTCALCKQIFDADADPRASDSRLPVLLLPCSHTVCRPCVRHAHQADLARHQQQAAIRASALPQQQLSAPDPRCPLPNCTRRIEVTQFDANAMSLVRQYAAMAAAASAATGFGMDVSASTAAGGADPFGFFDAAAGGGGASQFAGLDASHLGINTSLSGPLNPKLRAQLQQLCRTPEEAQRAEQMARALKAVQRTFETTLRMDFDEARAERDAAVEAAESKEVVVGTLQQELGRIDEQLHKLQLDRQVVLLQLQQAIADKSTASKWRVESDMRLLELQRRMQATAEDLERRASAIQELAPGVALG